MVFISLGAMNAQTKLYLDLSQFPEWEGGSAKFQAYLHGGDTPYWSDKFDEITTNVYETAIPAGDWTNVVILRRGPDSVMDDWNWGGGNSDLWNQSNDLVLECSNCVRIWDWSNSASWATYIPSEMLFFLDVNGQTNWADANAVSQAYVYSWDTDADANVGVWSDALEGFGVDYLYSTTLPVGVWEKILVVRRGPFSDLDVWNWGSTDNDLWNQTIPIALELKCGKNCLDVTGWSSNDGVVVWKTTPVTKNSINFISPQTTFIKGDVAAICAGFEGSAAIELYTLNGTLLKKTVAVDSFEQTGLAPGLYIVKINGKASKVLVR